MDVKMLKQAAAQLREITSKYEAMRKIAESAKRAVDAYEISIQMAEKGLIGVDELRKTAQELANSDKDLKVVKEAVEMNSGEGGLVLTIGDDIGDNKLATSSVEAAKMQAMQKLTEGIL